MRPLPDEDNTPFSVPLDVPEVMPLDYPGLDSNIDPHEAYDEGLDDAVDGDPYRPDDDPIKSARHTMRTGMNVRSYVTTDHQIIRDWIEDRDGHPALVHDMDEMGSGGLYVLFGDDEPIIDAELIEWKKFFNLFEKYDLAFLFENKTTSGAESRFYKFINHHDIDRITEAVELP